MNENPQMRTWIRRHAVALKIRLCARSLQMLVQLVISYVVCVGLVAAASFLYYLPTYQFKLFLMVLFAPLSSQLFDKCAGLLLHPLLAGVLLVGLLAWATLRQAHIGWVQVQPFTGMCTEGEGNFMYDARKTHLGLGYAVSMIWHKLHTFYYHPVTSAADMVATALALRKLRLEIPDGADALVGRLREAFRIRNWNPVTEFPELLPVLETMLALGVVRLRNDYLTGTEVRLTEEYLKFLERADGEPAVGCC